MDALKQEISRRGELSRYDVGRQLATPSQFERPTSTLVTMQQAPAPVSSLSSSLASSTRPLLTMQQAPAPVSTKPPTLISAKEFEDTDDDSETGLG
jgi:hypothetical protein